jgi:hypothetical protein
MTAELAGRNGGDGSPFGSILAEALMEMESAALAGLQPEDAVERLSLAAHLAITSQTGGPLPRMGGHVYVLGAVTPPATTHPQLDVRF